MTTPHNTTQNAASGLARAILLCAFFLSGGTGLVYEVVWVRLMTRSTGGTGLAIGLVLSIFMAGLALGGWLAGRWADRLKDVYAAVWIYGALELAVGVYSCAFPSILSCMEPLHATLYRHFLHNAPAFNLCTFLASGLVLLVPTTLMGATLPFLCRFCVAGAGRIGIHIGLLYAMNTAGAAMGAALAGFWLIRAWGVSGSLLAAAAVNLAIGLGCLAAPRVRRSLGSVRALFQSQPPSMQADLRGSLPVMGLLAVSGFCSMAYEVIWTRLLSLLIGPTTYSFTLVLIAFIAGLAVGSVVVGWLADRTSRPTAWLISLQLAGALTALATSQFLGNSQFFFSKLIYTNQDSFARLQLGQGLLVFTVMIPTAFCMGGLFPMANRAVTASIANIGKVAGRIYTFNTVGALLGAAISGLVMLQHFGKDSSLAIVVGVQAFSVAVFVLVTGLRPSWLRTVFLVVAGLEMAAVLSGWPHWNPLFFTEGKYHRFSNYSEDLESVGYVQALRRGNAFLTRHHAGEKLLYAGDGPGGFCTVVENVNYVGCTNITLSVSGKADASSEGDKSTQMLSAHLPMLMHPAPKSVMVLGLASGITAGEVLRYPVERLDILEISPQVVQASDCFRAFNNDVLKDPRTDLIVQDGRLHLRFTDRRYDVITSEPSNPWMAGLATLYTREFLQDARAHLEPGGLFVQFMHAYQMNWPTFTLVGRTLLSVFPECRLMQTGVDGDLLFVCYRDQPPRDRLIWPQNLASASRSPFIRIPSADVLSPLFVADNLKDLFGPGPLNTDDRPILEYLAPLSIFDQGFEVTTQLKNLGRRSTQATDGSESREKDPKSRVDRVEFLASVNAWPYGLVSPEDLAPPDAARYRAAVDTYAARNTVLSLQRLSASERASCLAVQLACTQAHYDRLPVNSPLAIHVLDNLARLLWWADRREESVQRLEEAWALAPGDVDIGYSLAMGLELTSRTPRAEQLLESLLADNPGSPRILRHMSERYLQAEQPERAEPLIRRLLAARPADDAATLMLSEIQRFRGDTAGALRSLDAVIARSPRHSFAYEKKAILLMEGGDYSAARRVIAQAIQLDPTRRALGEVQAQLDILSGGHDPDSRSRGLQPTRHPRRPQ